MGISIMNSATSSVSINRYDNLSATNFPEIIINIVELIGEHDSSERHHYVEVELDLTDCRLPRAHHANKKKAGSLQLCSEILRIRYTSSIC
jgi:hypothetical protein